MTTDVAKARHVAALTGMGIPVPCRGITVEQVNLVYFPTWIGVLRLRDAERLIGVSGRTGNPVQVISAALTAKISHVRPHLT